MFQRGEYTFDVGSSMMFGFGDKGYLNLLTRALAVVGKKLETILDPNQITYHLPKSKRFPEVQSPPPACCNPFSQAMCAPERMVVVQVRLLPRMPQFYIFFFAAFCALSFVVRA